MGYDDLKNYDFASQLNGVELLLKDLDITIVNLETRLAGRQNGGYTGYPFFNCPEQLAFCLKKVGVDVVALSKITTAWIEALKGS